ncbi:MAG TPA: polymer-forming cytoskeletal protein [Acidiferrobacter sp.]|nr:polymer-forming cytoskeletal protein [Acidiferrobacter sp.]
MLEKMGKKSGEKPCNTIDTLVGEQTQITGNLTFSGGLRIDGKIQGDITAQGDDSTLILSERGEIVGNMHVPHLIINGTIKGNVRSTERVELQAKAKITGDMTYKTLEMALGATVDGSLIHDVEKDSPRLKAIGGIDPVIS